MAITFAERPNSRQSSENPRSLVFHYVLAGIFEHGLARALAYSSTPAFAEGLWRQDIKLEPAGFSIWYVEVPYGPAKRPEPMDFEWAFDTSGGSSKITQAKEHIASYPADTAPDHKGAIGVGDDGNVEGCDVVTPVFKWQEKWQLPMAMVTWNYSQVVAELTGRTNNAPFRGFPIGEILFQGAQGGGCMLLGAPSGNSSKDPNIVEMTFHFARSPGVQDLTVGTITGVDKKGWEYAWVEYETNDSGTRKTRRPVAVHVERIYDAGNLALLGIGT